MNAQREVGMHVAVVDQKVCRIVLGETQEVAQQAVETDGQNVVATRQSKVERGAEVDLHLLRKREILVAGDRGGKVVRALEGRVLRGVGFDRGLRLESGQGDRDVVLAFLLACQLDKGLGHTLRRGGFKFRPEVSKVLIA